MTRPSGVIKKWNGYADQLGSVFDDAPKAVIAAVAVSSLTMGGDYLDEAASRFMQEWKTLFDAGIVPQKPPAKLLELIPYTTREAME